jgi:hypothetical protein
LIACRYLFPNLEKSAAIRDVMLATIGLRRRKLRAGAIGWEPEDVLRPVCSSHARKPGQATPGIGLHIDFRA